MASTIGLTGLLSSSDGAGTILEDLIDTATSPYTGTINYTGVVADTSRFASSPPKSKTNAIGVGEWTVSASARFPGGGADFGDVSDLTYSSLDDFKVSSWTLNMNWDEFDDTGMAAAGVTWREWVMGALSWTATVQCNIDDTTALPAVGASATATFKINDDTADNTLAGTALVQNVSGVVSRGARNTATVTLQGTGDLTSAGTNPLFPAGALDKSAVTGIVLRAEGDVDYEGEALLRGCTISTGIGQLIDIGLDIRGTGALTRGS